VGQFSVSANKGMMVVDEVDKFLAKQVDLGAVCAGLQCHWLQGLKSIMTKTMQYLYH